jgi:Fe-S oxidoreductase
MAKLKYEFLQHYYTSNSGKGHPLRDYLFAYIGQLAHIGNAVVPIFNLSLALLQSSGAGERLLRLSRHRRFPILNQRFQDQTSSYSPDQITEDNLKDTVLLLPDAFTRYFQPDVERAGRNVLNAAGFKVVTLPVIGAGRTLISKGFLKQARKHAQKVVDSIAKVDPSGVLPVIGLEPSEIYSLKDEYQDLLAGHIQVSQLMDRTFMIDEFLLRPGKNNSPLLFRIVDQQSRQPLPIQHVLLHGHCYQKAQPPHSDGYPIGVAATIAALNGVGYQVSVIDGGCCGMAGAFGYEAEHYAVSMQVGELALFPAVRKAGEGTLISACGTSCQAQIKDGTGKEALHPILLIENMLQTHNAK